MTAYPARATSSCACTRSIRTNLTVCWVQKDTSRRTSNTRFLVQWTNFRGLPRCVIDRTACHSNTLIWFGSQRTFSAPANAAVNKMHVGRERNFGVSTRMETTLCSDQVDVVGGTWFLRTKWVKYLFRENLAMRDTGEDYHLYVQERIYSTFVFVGLVAVTFLLRIVKCTRSDRWSCSGCPIRLMIGWQNGQKDAF
jgi:hypothetical protein